MMIIKIRKHLNHKKNYKTFNMDIIKSFFLQMANSSASCSEVKGAGRLVKNFTSMKKATQLPSAGAGKVAEMVRLPVMAWVVTFKTYHKNR